MPLIDAGLFRNPYLVYDAPEDEKTIKIREKFKIDPMTGYSEFYHWRPMSRLGHTYDPADPFLKFDRFNPDGDFSRKVNMALIVGGVSTVVHVGYNVFARKPWYSKAYIPAIISGIVYESIMYINKLTLQKQSIKQAMTVDYIRKHPERFGPIKREKFREVLYEHIPIR